jgi:hypothetical protein
MDRAALDDCVTEKERGARIDGQEIEKRQRDADRILT